MNLHDRERQMVRELGGQLGYGNLMHTASELWTEDLQGSSYAGGEFVVGPAKALTTPCGCEHPHSCEWCCGTSWLTLHVKSIKDREVPA